jgi:AraC family transcriptional regulator
VSRRLTLLCRGYEQKPLAWSGMREMLYVSIPCLNIEPQYAVCDSHVVALVLNMRSEIEAGSPSGRLYGEALSAALAARLQARFSRDSPLGEPVEAPLSATQLARVSEYIRTNLAADMGVAELAALVNLSPHYFSMLFRRALGVPPHQYVLQERIAEACRLLAAGQMTLSELASSLGFADQSHFSRAFRKITGMTPRMYRHKS